MSFICQVCNGYGDTPTRAVTKYEPITHPERTDLGGYHDKGGEGWRIVSEVVAHQERGQGRGGEAAVEEDDARAGRGGGHAPDEDGGVVMPRAGKRSGRNKATIRKNARKLAKPRKRRNTTPNQKAARAARKRAEKA